MSLKIKKTIKFKLAGLNSYVFKNIKQLVVFIVFWIIKGATRAIADIKKKKTYEN